MWDIVQIYFQSFPAQAKVAKYLLDYGFSIRERTIYIDKIRIPFSELARVLDVDKRVIIATVNTIESNPMLSKIYNNLIPACNLTKVAPHLGWGVIEISLSEPGKPGVLGNIATIIGKANVNIKQTIGNDSSNTMNGLIYIITEGDVPGELINKLKMVEGVKSITLR